MVYCNNLIETETNSMAVNNGNCGNVIYTTDKSNGNCGNEIYIADKSSGHCKNGPNTSEQMGLMGESSGKMNEFAGGQKPISWKDCVVIFLICSLVTALICMLVTKSSSGSCPATTVLSCPSGWVGYKGRCYYFSESEGTWYSSQSNCSASGASLVVIEDQKEMKFIMQVKGSTESWIGLKRKEGQPWQWADGTVFNGWFKIGADGPCAYLNDEKASSTLCGIRQNWICSKSAHTA